MNRRQTLSLSALVASTVLLSSNLGLAQQKSLKEQLVGSWTLVSSQAYGDKPLGSYMFDDNGRFSAILLRNDLPKYVSNSRLQATPAEQKATIEGSLALFGTWTVDGTDLKLHIEGSSFPNWTGMDQKRTNVTISGDELRYIQPTPSANTSPQPLVWRRAK